MNSDLDVRLRLSADGKGMVAVVRNAKGEVQEIGKVATTAGHQVDAGMDKAEASVQAVGRAAVATSTRMESSFKRGGSAVESLGRQVQNVQKLLLGLVGFAAMATAIGTVTNLADAHTNLASKIRLVSATEAASVATRAKVYEIAQDTRQELTATGELYTRLARATESLNLAESQRLRITETINKAFVVSGATTTEATAAVIQLSQGLAAGALRGEEFNSVAEQAPILMDMLAKSLGKSRGELRAMAEDGKITAEVLTTALLAGGADVDRQFAGMALTIAAAKTQLKNAFTSLIGEFNQTTGASQLVAAGISLIARNLEPLATAALTVAAAWGVKYVASLALARAATVAQLRETVALTAAELREAQSAEVVAVAQLAKAQAMAAAGLNIGRVVAAETALAAAQTRTAAALAANGAAIAANTGLLARFGSGLLGLVGGPVGAAILAVGGLAYVISDVIATERERDQAMRDGIASVVDMTREVESLRANHAALGATPSPPIAEAMQRAADATALVNEQQQKLADARERLASLENQNARSVARFGLELESYRNARSAVEELTASLARLQSTTGGLVGDVTQRFAPAIDVGAAALKRMRDAANFGDAWGALRNGIRDVFAEFGAINTADAQFRKLWASIKSETPAAAEALEKQGKSASQLAQATLDAAVAAAKRAGQSAETIAALQAEGSKLVELRKEYERNAEASKRNREESSAAAKAERERLAELERQLKAVGSAMVKFENVEQSLAAELGGAGVEAAQAYADRLELIARWEQRMLDLGPASAEMLARVAKARSDAAEVLRREQLQAKYFVDEHVGVLNAMRDELAALSMTAEQREISNARRQEEQALLRANIDPQSALGRQYIAEAEAIARATFAAREHIAATQEFRSIGMNAIGGISDAFGDFISRRGKDFGSMLDAMKSSLKRWVADVVSLLTQRTLTNVFSRMLGGGVTAGGGGWGSVLGGLFGSSSSGSGNIVSMLGGLTGNGGSGNILTGILGNGGVLSGGFSLNQLWGGGLNASAAQSYGVLNTPTGYGPATAQGGLGMTGTVLAGLGGAIYGYNRTNGGLPGVGAAAAYGAGAIGVAGTLSGLAGGASLGAAAGGAFSALGGAAVIPVVGWILAAVAAVDMITGGKVFGTKFRPEKAVEELRINAQGGTATSTLTEVRQRSMFRGRKWQTTTKPGSAEAQQAASALYDAVEGPMKDAAARLKKDMPPVIDAAIRTVVEYDKKGKVKTTQILVDVAGRTYKAKDAEEAATRVIAEGLIKVLDAATVQAQSLAKPIIAEAIGKMAHVGDEFRDFGGGRREGGGGGFVDAAAPALSEIQVLANRWRNDAAKLLEGAQFLVAAQEAINANGGLLGDGGTLTATTDLVERLARGEETMSATFVRLLDATTLLRNAASMMDTTLVTTGAAFVEFSQNFVDAAGGLDQARALWDAYFQNFYSASERSALAQQRINEQFAEAAAQIGLDTTIDTAGFRAALDEAMPTLSAEELTQWLRFAQVLAQVEQQRAALEQAERNYSAWLQQLTLDVSGTPTEFQRAMVDIQASTAQYIADANALAIARGQEGASAQDLALIHRWAAQQVKRAIAELENSASGLIGELGYGPLAAIEAQIAALEGSGQSSASAIEGASASAENFFQQFADGLDNLGAYLDSMLLGDLSPLSPEEQLAESRRQLQATAQAARAGDVTALNQLQGMTEQFLRLARGFHASGADYGAEFDWARSQISGIVNPYSPGGQSGVPSTVALVPSEELRALYAQRDELLAAQEAERRSALAAQLAAYIVELASVTGETVFQAAERLGVNFAQFVQDLGGDVGAETAAAVTALGLVANTLNVELPELADRLGLALGELTDAQSLLNDAFELQLQQLPEGFRAQLEPALRDLENANTQEQQVDALGELNRLTEALPEEFRLALAPYLSSIDPINASTFTDLDYLSTIDTNMAAAKLALQDILLELRGGAAGGSTQPGSPDPDPGAYVAATSGSFSPKALSGSGANVTDPALLEEMRALRAEVVQLRTAVGNGFRDNTDAVKSGSTGTDSALRRLGDDIRSNRRSTL